MIVTGTHKASSHGRDQAIPYFDFLDLLIFGVGNVSPTTPSHGYTYSTIGLSIDSHLTSNKGPSNSSIPGKIPAQDT